MFSEEDPEDYSRAIPVPYEIRIGVTGHRNLNDEAGVRSAVEQTLKHIDTTLRRSVEKPRSGATTKRAFRDWFDRALLLVVKAVWWQMPLTPHRVSSDRQVPLLWRVVSPLAKGADQIVADIILNQYDGKLDAVLPFESVIYENDFDTTEERSAFNALLSQKDSEWVAPIDIKDSIPSSQQRTLGYKLAGEQVADNCDILIAVWDKKPKKGEGGTAEIVEYAKHHDVPLYWIDSTNPSNKAKLLTDNDSPNDERELPRTVKEVAPRYHQLSAYYRDTGFKEIDYKQIYDRETKSLVEIANKLKLDNPVVNKAIHHRLAEHAYADQLAITHQSLHLRSTISIFLFAAAAVTAGAIQIIAFKNATWLIAFEITFMFAAAIMLRVSRREGWHEKWLYDRYLAERLRAIMFCEGVGSREIDSTSTQHIHPFYDGPSAWVDSVLDYKSENTAPEIKGSDFEALKSFVNEAWIKSQAKWHAKHAYRKEREHKRFNVTTLTLFTLTLMCAILHLFHFGEDGTSFYIPGLAPLISIMVIVLPAWGGTIHGIDHLLDFGRLAKRSQRMHDELNKLSYEITHAKDHDTLVDIVRRADKLMAMENLEWMMTLAHNKAELHV